MNTALKENLLAFSIALLLGGLLALGFGFFGKSTDLLSANVLGGNQKNVATDIDVSYKDGKMYIYPRVGVLGVSSVTATIVYNPEKPLQKKNISSKYKDISITSFTDGVGKMKVFVPNLTDIRSDTPLLIIDTTEPQSVTISDVSLVMQDGTVNSMRIWRLSQ